MLIMFLIKTSSLIDYIVNSFFFGWLVGLFADYFSFFIGPKSFLLPPSCNIMKTTEGFIIIIFLLLLCSKTIKHKIDSFNPLRRLLNFMSCIERLLFTCSDL